VSNTRYTPWNFLPLNLINQFRAPLNLYFLLVAFLQLWRAITPVNPLTTWAPLLLVTAVSTIKEAVDEVRRMKLDKQANARPYAVYGSRPEAAAGAAAEGAAGGSTVTRSEDIRVGHLVLVREGEPVPCDLLLLKVGSRLQAAEGAEALPSVGGEGEGVAYVETSNLDGETDLKKRRAPPETQALPFRPWAPANAPASAAASAAAASTAAFVAAMRGSRVVCEPPNSHLYHFDSSLHMRSLRPPVRAAASGTGRDGPAPEEVTLSGEQLVQHGTVLRRTAWILGAAIYTGADTKLNQSKMTHLGAKVALTDKTINKLTVLVFVMQAAAVLLLGWIGYRWIGNGNANYWFLGWGTAASGPAATGDAAHAPGGWPASAAESLAQSAVPLDLAPGLGASTDDPAANGIGAATGAAAAAADAGTDWASERERLEHEAGGALAEALKQRGAVADAVAVAGRVLAETGRRALGALTGAFSGAIDDGGSPHLLHRSASSGTGHGKGGGKLAAKAAAAAAGLAASLHHAHSVPSAATAPPPSQPQGQPWYTPLVLPLRFFLLSSMMVPISLKITLDLIKVFYAKLIASDLSMYDPETDTPAAAMNTAIAEDLGRVDVLLTDKTGTLTENVMRVVRLSVNDTEIDVSGDNDAADAHTTQSQPATRPGQRLRSDLLHALALCNSVEPEHMDAVPLAASRQAAAHATGIGALAGSSAASPFPSLAQHDIALRRRKIQFASASPDEEALVHCAASQGVALSFRKQMAHGTHEIQLHIRQDAAGELAKNSSDLSAAPLSDVRESGKSVWINDTEPISTFEVLHTLEFTSDRKRMSVIVRNKPDFYQGSHSSATGQPPWSSFDGGGLFIITKGADETVFTLLADPSCAAAAAAQSHLDSFASKGLRTLMVAYRPIDPRAYAAWLSEWTSANAEVGPRRPKALESACEAIEKDLIVIGCTAIEDKLQQGVPECIQSLRKAGIRVWMLTGDKCSTALQIAQSAGIANVPLSTPTAARTAEALLAGTESELKQDPTSVAALTATEARISIDTPRSTVQSKGIHAAVLLNIHGTDAATVEEELHNALHTLRAWERIESPQHLMQPMQATLPLPKPKDTSPRRKTAFQGEYTTISTQEEPSLNAERPLLSPVMANPVIDVQDSGRVSQLTSRREHVLVVQGHALHFALTEHRSAVLARVALECDSVIFSRCTPSQKAALVSLVNASGNVSLAIGDGGNDVAMIQSAHVGVGITGKEGQQAARAADYSISRFRFLESLVLVHGRYSHYRTALTAQYTFYKSMEICFIQLLFNALCSFSGCSLLDTFALTTYNMLYTSLPGILMVLDTDRPKDELLRKPELFLESRVGLWITTRTYLGWLFRALVQSCLIVCVCIKALGANGGLGGDSLDQSSVSYAVFTSIILVQMFTIIFDMKRPTIYNYWMNIGGLVCFALFMLIRTKDANGAVTGIVEHTGSTASFWYAVAGSTFMALVPFIAFAWWERLFGGPSELEKAVASVLTSSSSAPLAPAVVAASPRLVGLQRKPSPLQRFFVTPGNTIASMARSLQIAAASAATATRSPVAALVSRAKSRLRPRRNSETEYGDIASLSLRGIGNSSNDTALSRESIRPPNFTADSPSDPSNDANAFRVLSLGPSATAETGVKSRFQGQNPDSNSLKV
jgi:magnesium-transporting ATPase (P-type)